MAVRPLAPADTEAVWHFWNSNVENEELPYRMMSLAEFTEKFIAEPPSMEKYNLVYEQGDEIVGFANGVYLPDKNNAYVTMVLVAPEFRNHGIGTALYQMLEDAFKHPATCAWHPLSLDHPIMFPPENVDILFFNPINLEWIVPGTESHDHPNSPGVAMPSAAYEFFKKQGFTDLALQHSYYRPLADYKVAAEITHKTTELREKGIEIALYDPELHDGFDELFDDLENEQWRELITANVEDEEGGAPVLIASDNGKIVGFTGPLRVQDSKRGYFAGIGVHSEYRSLGAGKVLFTYLCKVLKDLGADYMTLFTGDTNPARRMYEANDFQIVKSWMDMRKALH